jgi:hypothetical protein
MKTWQKPRLIVLVRTTPGETVLSNCKTQVSGTSPDSTDLACFQEVTGAAIVCSICLSIGQS